MKPRSRAGGEASKARHRKALKPKRRDASKTASSSAPNQDAEVARLTRELNEALERQAATSEVLEVISGSPGDLQPVFAAMLENAVRICDAKFGNIYRWDGEALHLLATHNTPPAFAEARRSPRRPDPKMPIGRMLSTKTAIHVVDLSADLSYIEQRIPEVIAAVELGAVRTFLAVPMLKENKLIGALSLSRQVVRPFTNRQVELVTNFAAQAVIAIENARLLNELRQSLERQTATSEVLQVISRSPGDLEPVFATMLDKAVSICDAQFGTLYLREADRLRLLSTHNVPPAFAEAQRKVPFRPAPHGMLDAVMKTGRAVHLADLAEAQSYLERDPRMVEAVEVGGIRSVVGVPLLKEGELIGLIGIYRQQVRPFTDKQIALVTSFAAQAVIAIENARLLNELRQRTDDLTERTGDLTEALEQQTATSQVLQVISSTPGDLEPVFTTILENATRICEAKFGNVYLWDGDAFRLIAAHNTPPAFAESRRREPFRPKPNHPFSGMAATNQVLHVPDAAALPAYIERDPQVVEPVELGGVRTCLAVPMLREDTLIGALIVYRQEVRPFTDKQIALIANFAAQAVIAIENARLLNELRQSLEQQTATSEVLQVISSSPGALQPVFDAMLTNATRLCEASFGILLRYENAAFHVAASHNAPPAFVELRRREPTIRASGVLRRVVATKQLLHISDCLEDASYKQGDADFVRFVDLCGARSFIAAPMLKDDELVGTITVFHQEVRPFTDKQVALVTNFAAQAVIAIENARLLNELRHRTNDLTERTADLTEALGQQTATSDVLKVISSSPGDLQPVFATMLEKAVRICDATFGNIYRWDGETSTLVASYNTPPAFAEYRTRSPIFRSGTPTGQTVTTKTVVHVADCTTSQAYLDRDPAMVAAVELGGVRSFLVVPMLKKEEELIGALALSRQEVRPFTDKQIELVQNFAAQAVIAIENARLLNELRQRTTDLTEALEQQTATSEVLQVISSSPGDLEPVFKAMLENAVRLFDAKFGNIYRWDGELMHLLAAHNTPPALAEARRQSAFRPSSIVRQMVETMKAAQAVDLAADKSYTDEPNPAAVAAVELGGVRTFLTVPMVRESELIGSFSLYRQEVRPFTDKQIELVENFAAQAVIAIENARLLNELRQSLEQQTATAEVLQVISSSPGDLQPVFAAMLENAARICDANFGNIFRWDGEALRLIATPNTPPAFAEARTRLPLQPNRVNPIGHLLATQKTVHIADLAADARYTEQHDPDVVIAVELGGIRTFVAVPMLKENKLIGALIVYRQEVRPFTDKQIALVENFAAQAVIAIENTRLLNELHERTDQLQAQSKELADLNQLLEQRVTDQVGEIERMGRLRRFLPPQVADLIVAAGTEKQLESHRREITALFCDLRGFTGFSESADPEDVMTVLREYHEALGASIIKYSGTLERYAGDGVMVVFNDPVPVENPALQAVLMALEMRDAIAALTETWRRWGHDIGFGIGIAHGFATLGTIGFEGRFDYAAIGTVSNVASRLCDEAKPGQILISPRVLTKVEDAVTVEPVGEFALKGIRRPLAAYNVVAVSPSKV